MHLTVSITRILILLAFATCLAIPAFAQETPTTQPTNPTETPVRGEGRANERGENRRVGLSQNFQNRIINLSKNVENRLTKASERLQNIIARLESRIDKLGSTGVDTTKAKELLTQAKNTHEAAVSTLKELGSTNTAISGETPRESFALIRTQFMAVRDLLRQTHALLGQTVAALKEAVQGATNTQGVSDAVNAASGTPEVN